MGVSPDSPKANVRRQRFELHCTALPVVRDPATAIRSMIPADSSAVLIRQNPSASLANEQRAGGLDSVLRTYPAAETPYDTSFLVRVHSSDPWSIYRAHSLSPLPE